MESHTTIPFFIEASDKMELVKKMLENNVKHGGFVQYFGIQQEKSGSWSAWYYEEMKEMLKQAKPIHKKQVVKKARRKKRDE